MALDFLGLLLKGDRHQATRLILDAVENGLPVREAYLEIFQPGLHEVGRLWQTNQISVAQEHYCTAATQLIMSQLYPKIFTTERNGRLLVATCVGGELHEIGIRMVADFFEMEGWDTMYLGADTPTDSLIETVQARNPDVLAISAAMTFNIAAVTELVRRVRDASPGKPKILVGGRPFNMSKELWKRTAADGYAGDALEAVRVGEALLSRSSTANDRYGPAGTKTG